MGSAPLVYSLRDRIVARDQLGAVGEGGLDLHDGEHGGHLVHHVGGGEHLAPELHQLDDAAAVARTFEQGLGDERGGLGDVEPQPSV